MMQTARMTSRQRCSATAADDDHWRRPGDRHFSPRARWQWPATARSSNPWENAASPGAAPPLVEMLTIRPGSHGLDELGVSRGASIPKKQKVVILTAATRCGSSHGPAQHAPGGEDRVGDEAPRCWAAQTSRPHSSSPMVLCLRSPRRGVERPDAGRASPRGTDEIAPIVQTSWTRTGLGQIQPIHRHRRP
jgi:hypothetical protein